MKFLSLPALLLSLFWKGTPPAKPVAKEVQDTSTDQSSWKEIESWLAADATPTIAKTETRRLRAAKSDSHLCWIMAPDQGQNAIGRKSGLDAS